MTDGDAIEVRIRHWVTMSEPLRYYAGCEELRGRFRHPVSAELFGATGDRTGHDRGDEDIER